jgi:hypothetical protein
MTDTTRCLRELPPKIRANRDIKLSLNIAPAPAYSVPNEWLGRYLGPRRNLAAGIRWPHGGMLFGLLGRQRPSSRPFRLPLAGGLPTSYAGLLSVTLVHVEKVRPQFLSLRQLAQVGVVSMVTCRQLSSRPEPPTVRFDPTTLSRRPRIPTKENSIVISMLLET